MVVNKSILTPHCVETIQERKGQFYTAARIACEGLINYADRLAREADRLAVACMDPDRAAELREISRICKKVPRKPADTFHDALARHTNTRNGPYVPGFYSSTSHVAFGEKTGAMPSGRMAGQPFAASLGAVNGCDRLGPTALLNSVSGIDALMVPNGYALNLRFDPNTVADERGTNLLSTLVAGFFASGGMELQFNILDPEQLQDARKHPGRYPDLVVRVAGYCAYFDDLPDTVKMEIISRTRLLCSS